MAESLRIAVTGLAATYPLGGVFWDYLQYVLGFARLGHDVLYIEDTGQWCYEPERDTYVEDGSGNARKLAGWIERLEPGLSNSWFFRDAKGQCFGRSFEDVAKFCRDADLFLHVSANCLMPDEYFAAKTVAFLDSDPMCTRSTIPDRVAGRPIAAEHLEWLRRHDVFLSFGENVGQADCRMSTEYFDWIPTRQPIVLDAFAGAVVAPEQRRPVATTVASWKHKEGQLAVAEEKRSAGKDMEFDRFMSLPSRSPLEIELALAGLPPVDRLTAAGFRVRDGYGVSHDPWVYREYLASSAAEWSVAKHAYVAGKTGWFSCRTACYLALGVPAVVQHTGFAGRVPTGEGLFAFDDLDGAARGLAEIVADPSRHARAAQAIARDHFDSNKVLSALLDVTVGARESKGSMVR